MSSCLIAMETIVSQTACVKYIHYLFNYYSYEMFIKGFSNMNDIYIYFLFYMRISSHVFFFILFFYLYYEKNYCNKLQSDIFLQYM